MRKILYTFMGLSALVLLASCNKTAESSATAGDQVKASFTVSLPSVDLDTKTISDGAQAAELLFMAYDQAGQHLDLDQTVTVTGYTATVTANLVKGVKYQFVFWAQKPGQYTSMLATDKLSLTINPADMMNLDDWDAFYWHEPVAEVTGAFSKDIVLKRPFAQLNVGAPVTLDESDNRTGGDFYAASKSAILIDANLTTSYTITVPNKLNLLDGTVDGSASVAMTAVAHPGEFLTVDDVKYDYAAMAYVLATDASATQDLVVTLNTKQNGTGIQLTRSVPNVPLRRNYRTNIIGNVFTVTGNFNITVDQNFNGSAYDDPLLPDYTATAADFTELNSLFASGITAATLEMETPTSGNIVLPNVGGDVRLNILGDFSVDKVINISYGSEAKPANLYVYAPQLYELNGSLPATHVEIVTGSYIGQGTLHTSTGTLVIQPKAYYGLLKIIGGSLRVEGTVAQATIDPVDVSEDITVTIIKDAAQEINGRVVVLNVSGGDVEVVATDADGNVPSVPEGTEEEDIPAVGTLNVTGGSTTITDGTGVTTVVQTGGDVEIENPEDVTNVQLTPDYIVPEGETVELATVFGALKEAGKMTNPVIEVDGTLQVSSTYRLDHDNTIGKITIYGGTEDAVFYMNVTTPAGGERGWELNGASVHFKDITLRHYAAEAVYLTLVRSAEDTYDNCIFEGRWQSCGTTAKRTFNNCTFNLVEGATKDYAIWIYSAGEYAFNDCTFNTPGRAVYTYVEAGNATPSYVADEKYNTNLKISFNNCAFDGKGVTTDKTAVQIKPAHTNAVYFNNCTVSGYKTGAQSSNLYEVENEALSYNDYVIVDGDVVYSK